MNHDVVTQNQKATAGPQELSLEQLAAVAGGTNYRIWTGEAPPPAPDGRMASI